VCGCTQTVLRPNAFGTAKALCRDRATRPTQGECQPNHCCTNLRGVPFESKSHCIVASGGVVVVSERYSFFGTGVLVLGLFLFLCRDDALVFF
jgi:hypothetical protein